VSDPIIIESGGYRAWTDGRSLRIALSNGVVVGEGQVGLDQGALRIGGYRGKLDDGVRSAVAELLSLHQMDIAVLRMSGAGGMAQA